MLKVHGPMYIAQNFHADKINGTLGTAKNLRYFCPALCEFADVGPALIKRCAVNR